VVRVRDVPIGESTPTIIADVWPIDDCEQLIQTAHLAREEGADIIGGFSLVPQGPTRSRRESGFGELQLLREVALASGLPTMIEVSSARDVDLALPCADLLQVGANNMQNFALLIELGRLQCPVFLNRGPAATINEWLLAAEYVLAGGNEQVILCECGIRNFETETQYSLDLAAVARVRELSHLPVMVDPSHGTGRHSLVSPMSKAAIAAGANGLKISLSTLPGSVREPGHAALSLSEFSELSRGLKPNWKARVSTGVIEQEQIEVHS
jgi:3-deoxy-7-phosphoheptulonate synthase